MENRFNASCDRCLISSKTVQMANVILPVSYFSYKQPF